MTSISWLHLSDFHFLNKHDSRDERARNSLLDLVKCVIAENTSLTPNLVFCTGDIGYGDVTSMSLVDQYIKASCFFDDLRQVCGTTDKLLPRERLFFVPGNHDISRQKINQDAQASLLNQARDPQRHIQKMNDRWHTLSCEIIEALKRLGDYSHFVQTYLPHQVDSSGRCSYAQMLNIGDVKVGIAGLNSTWSSSGAEDDRHLWMAAEAQINASASIIRDADVRIMLMHHPADWLNKMDQDIVTHRLGIDCEYLLHGHTHNAWLTPTADHVVIAAGAVCAEQVDEFGINFVKLDFDSSKGEAHLYSYSPRDGGWKPCCLPHKAPKGVWAFNLPVSARLHERHHGDPESSKAAKPSVLTFSDFFIRPQANLFDYEDKVTGGDLNMEVQQFNVLYQDCFSHHLIEELSGDPLVLLPSQGDAKRIIDSDNLDAFFLRNFEPLPRVTQTANTDERDKMDRVINFEMFLKAITDPPLRQYIPPEAQAVGENRVSYLLGDAGMGKTLAVLKLLDRVRLMSPDYRGYKIIPVYIDLHQIELHPKSSEDAVSFLTRKIIDDLVRKATGFGVANLAGVSSSGTILSLP